MAIPAVVVCDLRRRGAFSSGFRSYDAPSRDLRLGSIREMERAFLGAASGVLSARNEKLCRGRWHGAKTSERNLLHWFLLPLLRTRERARSSRGGRGRQAYREFDRVLQRRLCRISGKALFGALG
jgi:hypothetical protein